MYNTEYKEEHLFCLFYVVISLIYSKPEQMKSTNIIIIIDNNYKKYNKMRKD